MDNTLFDIVVQGAQRIRGYPQDEQDTNPIMARCELFHCHFLRMKCSDEFRIGNHFVRGIQKFIRFFRIPQTLLQEGIIIVLNRLFQRTSLLVIEYRLDPICFSYIQAEHYCPTSINHDNQLIFEFGRRKQFNVNEGQLEINDFKWKAVFIQFILLEGRRYRIGSREFMNTVKIVVEYIKIKKISTLVNLCGQ